MDAFWTIERVSKTLEADRPLLIAPDGRDAFDEWVGARADVREAVEAEARKTMERRIDIFSTYPPAETWPWHCDWRWNHCWEPRFFRRYSLYEARNEPYDVKVPWELSRLGFLIPVLAAGALRTEQEMVDFCAEAITSWIRENPLAYSVNWHPMEASIRIINLTFVLELLHSIDANRTTMLRTLYAQLTGHAEFLWRTIEYSDVRGNHYAANLVGLLIAGLKVRSVYPRGYRWAAYGWKRILEECLSQFGADGVHVEQSTSYHRFVTELFTIALVAGDRVGLATPLSVKSRLKAAVRYCEVCRKPDGVMPNVGDNDDAQALCFRSALGVDPAAVVELAGGLLEDDRSASTAEVQELATPWILGRANRVPSSGLSASKALGVWHFNQSGVVVVRSREIFCWIDVGECGLWGTGGHGHNDVGAFELAWGGTVIAADRGCPVYTGDLKQRDEFRSSRSHNVLVVDGHEIARMEGPWEIRDEARPVDVRVEQDDAVVSVMVSHHGYRRLRDPVIVRRTLEFHLDERRVVCRDSVECQGAHALTLRLYLSSGIQASIDREGAILKGASGFWRVSYGDGTEWRVEPSTLSPRYGVVADCESLVACKNAEGPDEMICTIRELNPRARGQPA